jgi:hypothetical protein
MKQEVTGEWKTLYKEFYNVNSSLINTEVRKSRMRSTKEYECNR